MCKQDFTKRYRARRYFILDFFFVINIVHNLQYIWAICPNTIIINTLKITKQKEVNFSKIFSTRINFETKYRKGLILILNTDGFSIIFSQNVEYTYIRVLLYLQVYVYFLKDKIIIDSTNTVSIRNHSHKLTWCYIISLEW